MATISGKSPDQAINKFKVAVINEQLRIANEILAGPWLPFESFELFDDVSLPSNSDVVVVLSQYLACLENWKAAHISQKPGDYFWSWDLVDENVMRTEKPTNRGGS